jgi:hypothetical protein
LSKREGWMAEREEMEGHKMGRVELGKDGLRTED